MRKRNLAISYNDSDANLLKKISYFLIIFIFTKKDQNIQLFRLGRKVRFQSRRNKQISFCCQTPTLGVQKVRKIVFSRLWHPPSAVMVKVNLTIKRQTVRKHVLK